MDSSFARRRSAIIKPVVKFGFCLVGLALVLSACQPSTPAIIQTFTQINHHFDPTLKKWSERLAVWTQVQNKDGWTDIQKIVIRHPASEVWWKLDKTNWAYRQNGEAIWLGTNNLETSQEDSIPTGTWTVTVVTKAGQTSESEFTLPAPLGVTEKPGTTEKLGTTEKPKLASPVFQDKPSIQIQHFPRPCLVWVYDSQGNFLSSIQFSDQVLTSPLFQTPSQGPPQARWLVFYTKNSDGEGLEAGPYLVR